MVTPTMPHTIDGIGLGVKSVGDYTINICVLLVHQVHHTSYVFVLHH